MTRPKPKDSAARWQTYAETLETLLSDVAKSGVAADLGGYVEVQIDRDTWRELVAHR